MLAGGTGSRLHPLTKVTNKHLLPVCDKPMIYYPIQTLRDNNITDIIIVTGREHMGDVVELLGDGSDFGAEFTYKVQDKPGGIAQALGLCTGLIEEDCVVILGDNIFIPSPVINPSEKSKIFVKSVPHPERFGVACMQCGHLTRIDEKPEKPKSDMAVTGLYYYKPAALLLINLLDFSQRGEIEITDLNNQLIVRNQLSYELLSCFWSDAGTFESMKYTQEYVWNNR